HSAHIRVIAIGQQTSASEPASKIAALDVGKQDSKSRTHSAHAGVTAIGRQTPASEPAPKVAPLEPRKHDRKGSASAGAIAASGEQKTLLAQKSRTPGIEVKRHGDGKPANGAEDRRAIGRRD